MGELHFLPAQRNNARLAAESTKDIGPMAEHSAKTLPQSSATLVVFDNNGSKTKRYEQLVQLYHADVYRYGYWLCKDPDIAQDLVQETFLRAWKSLDSLLDAGAAKAWLITIVRRENARRFERRQFDYDDAAEQDSLPDTAQTSAEQDCDNDTLRRHMAALAEEYREPLILQVLGGFSSDEIAAVLQLNVNTVNTRLFRARKLLRDSLMQPGESRHG